MLRPGPGCSIVGVPEVPGFVRADGLPAAGNLLADAERPQDAADPVDTPTARGSAQSPGER
jgi:hypothetical protein